MISLVGLRTLLLLASSLALACGDGEAAPPGPVPMPPGRAPTYDAGADGCGLSFADAVDAFAPERVCQTTVYDRVTGYCTHWVACSSL